MRTVLATAFLLLAAGLTNVAAQDKPLDRAEIDKRAARAAYDAAGLGTDIFNKGDHGGCFRLYQGTLMGLLPMLDHQPKLSATVKDKLDKAKGLRATDGAMVLREALDAVMGDKKAADGTGAGAAK